jgi:hypothetical protein
VGSKVIAECYQYCYDVFGFDLNGLLEREDILDSLVYHAYLCGGKLPEKYERLFYEIADPTHKEYYERMNNNLYKLIIEEYVKKKKIQPLKFKMEWNNQPERRK